MVDVSAAEQATRLAALADSVVADRSALQPTPMPGIFSLLLAGAYSDAIPPWGTNVWYRDAELRRFITKEHYFNAALGIVSARNAGLSWDLTGRHPRLIEASQQMLNNVNFGGGWEEFMVQTTVDLSTQDRGAFVEFVHYEPDNPASPVIEINHLDAQRCWSTGNPMVPVIYQDELGAWHEMKWFQVYQLLEMPAGVTSWELGWFGKIQYCALTRALQRARVMADIWQYQAEKIGGRFTRELILIQGIGEKQVQDALIRSQAANDAEGLRRFAPATLVGTIDPTSTIDVKRVELASVPDGFDEELATKNYILALAMAFMTDYQEFAPLPGGNLGTSEQSDILDKKGRGKGPALYMKMISRMLNHAGVLPRGVEFAFNEPDPDAAKDDADLQKTRAETMEINVRSGVWTPEFARQWQLDTGDITEEQFQVLTAETGDEDLTDTVILQGEEKPDSEMTPEVKAIADAVRQVRRTKAAGAEVSFGPLLNGRLHRAYATTSDDIGSLGYFETVEDRVKVASAIGPALAVLQDALTEAGLWDLKIAAADADAIVDRAGKAWTKALTMDVNPSDVADVSDEGERVAIESEVQQPAQAGLLVLRENIRRRLTELVD